MGGEKEIKPQPFMKNNYFEIWAGTHQPNVKSLPAVWPHVAYIGTKNSSTRTHNPRVCSG